MPDHEQSTQHSTAVKITPANLTKGTLTSLSFARPTKLFTANEALMIKRIAILNDATFRKILSVVIDMLQKVMPASQDATDELTQRQDKDN